MSKAREVALIAMISALCIVSRWTLTFLPNIKPVTSIIILMSATYGWKFGVKVAFVTTMVSNMLLGMGTWTIFQILAWTTIAFVAGLFRKQILSSIVFAAVFVFLAGFMFGLVVSLDRLLIGGPLLYLVYWLSGLPFDLMHAAGNVIFFPLCRVIVNRTCGREAA